MTIGREQIRELRRLAGECCEYCLLGEDDRTVQLQIDHIIPIKHGGDDSTDNLCLACSKCNSYKGPNVAGLDPMTGEATMLFHPRNQSWKTHFVLNADGSLAGLTPEGRSTIFVLRMNAVNRIAQRQKLILLGRYPCEKP